MIGKRYSILICLLTFSGFWLLCFDSVSAQSSVTWQNPVNVAVSGGTITKSTSSGWDAGASSVQSIPSGYNGYVEFSTTNNAGMAGLSNGDSNADYPDIDYAIQPGPNYGLTVAVYEKGIYQTTSPIVFNPSDIFQVALESGVVKYYHNRTLIHTSSVSPTYPLLFDTALYANGGQIQNAVIVSSPIAGSSPTPSPSTSSGPTSTVLAPPPPGPQANKCVLSSATWMASGGQGNINVGESAALAAYGQGCDGLTASFDIYEWDPTRNDYITTVQATFSGIVAQACYTFTNQDYVKGGDEVIGENLLFDAKVFDQSGNQMDIIHSPQIVFLKTPETGTGCGGGGIGPSQPGKDQLIKWGIFNPLIGMSKTQNVFDLIVIIADWILNIAGSLIIILIIYSGVRFLISRGNPGEIQKAKSILFWALVGFGVILIGKGFIYLIESVLQGKIPIFL